MANCNYCGKELSPEEYWVIREKEEERTFFHEKCFPKWREEV